jgi:hypothetical protein
MMPPALSGNVPLKMGFTLSYSIHPMVAHPVTVQQSSLVNSNFELYVGGATSCRHFPFIFLQPAMVARGKLMSSE